jgi:hypothetical protein
VPDIDLAALDDSPGSLVAEPAAPEVTPEPPVESTEPTPEATEPEAEATFDPKGLLAGLTPEQRKSVLDAWDLDEITTHERVSGRVGSMADRIAADKLKAQQQRQGQQSLDALARQARTDRDGDKALEYVDAETEARTAAQHAAAWTEASETYDFLKADPLTEPLLQGITGKDYGELSNGNGTIAALMFESDMARNVRAALPALVESVRERTKAEMTEQLTAEITARVEKRYETEVKPTLQKEARAKAGLEVPPNDTGTGRPPNGQADDERDAVRNYADGKTTTAPDWVLEAVGIPARR